jgi:hypothetical protein
MHAQVSTCFCRWKATRAIAPLLQYDTTVLGNAFQQVVRQLALRVLGMKQWGRVHRKSVGQLQTKGTKVDKL